MDVKIREARAEDRDSVASFADSTWDGWDYVPDAWDDWLDDGVALVAERDGRPAGTVHAVTRDGEAWIEGLRVDDEHRREGVGTALIDAIVERLAESGASVARCMAFEENDAAVSFLEDAGFERSTTVRHARGFGFPYGTALEAADYDESLEVIRDTDALESVGGLYATTDWRMWSVPDSVEDYDGEILGFVEDDDVRGIAICDGVRVNDTGEERRTELVLGFVWVEPRYASQFALDVRGEAREREIHDAVVFLPDGETVDAFEQAGFDFDRYDHIYEKVIR